MLMPRLPILAWQRGQIRRVSRPFVVPPSTLPLRYYGDVTPSWELGGASRGLLLLLSARSAIPHHG